MRILENTQLKSWQDYETELFRMRRLWRYGMHYWYLKLADFTSGRLSSFILTQNKIPTRVNRQSFQLSPEEFVLIQTDFSDATHEISKIHPDIRADAIHCPAFEVRLRPEGLELILAEKRYYFHQLAADGYRANALNFYRSCSLNTTAKSAHLMIQNVLKQGPLMPWQWLHLHLADGTYINYFRPLNTLNRSVWVGDEIWKLEKNQLRKDRLLVRATRADQFLEMELVQKYTVTTDFQPQFSSRWSYRQIEVQLGGLKSNHPQFNKISSGMGILEIARGFSF